MTAREPELDRVLIRTGATYRQLDHWCRREYLDVPGYGVGTPRQWPESEIKVAQVMVRLTKAGIPPKVACKIARGTTQIGPGITVTVE